MTLIWQYKSCNTLWLKFGEFSKVRFQHDTYPSHTEQASRQVLVISDMEIRDRLADSKINKFLYQYSSEHMPKQTNSNMVSILKASFCQQ